MTLGNGAARMVIEAMPIRLADARVLSLADELAQTLLHGQLIS